SEFRVGSSKFQLVTARAAQTPIPERRTDETVSSQTGIGRVAWTAFRRRTPESGQLRSGGAGPACAQARSGNPIARRGDHRGVDRNCGRVFLPAFTSGQTASIRSDRERLAADNSLRTRSAMEADHPGQVEKEVWNQGH